MANNLEQERNIDRILLEINLQYMRVLSRTKDKYLVFE
jgi:hypothetical protein